MQKIVIIHNPNSGKNKSHKHAVKLEKAIYKIKCDAKITLLASTTFTILEEFMKNIPEDHYDLFVIIGGDGTIGPTVNMMKQYNVDIPIYCYGRGTANDFASFFKTNVKPRKAAKKIAQGQVTNVDTLLIDDKVFACNVACGGAFTNGVTQYSKKGKRIFGKLAYMAKAIAVAFRLESQILKFRVDDEEFELDVFLFYILNTKNVGGLKNSSPLSEVDDGMLDLVALKRCGVWGKISLAFHQAFGIMHKCKYVKHMQGKNFTVSHREGDEVKHNFTFTDTDGNPYAPYPLHVRVSDKIKVVH